MIRIRLCGETSSAMKAMIWLASGSLSKSPEIVGSHYKTGDLFYDSAVESARRAVLKCAPLKHLPVDKYARWREITLTFNPREMLGG